MNNKLHKVIRLSKARDELIAWCYTDKKRVLYSYVDVKKKYGKRIYYKTGGINNRKT